MAAQSKKGNRPRVEVDAAAEAKHWADENKDGMKEVDHILYRSDESYYGKVVPLSPEDAESMVAESSHPDPEAFLPKDVRDYDDHTCEQNPYHSKDSDSDGELYLSKNLAAGLHNLTDLQREVIFRNVINGEDVSSIAKCKNCSARNIRDIRNRALKALRVAATMGQEGSGTIHGVLVTLWILLLCVATYFLFVPGAAAAWQRTAVFVALPIVTVAVSWKTVRRALNAAKGKFRRALKKKRK